MSDKQKNKKRILVADDNRVILGIVRKVLEARDFDIQTVLNGEEAKEVLKTEEFDLLISDINMEPMDGMQLLRHSRQVCPEMGIIMLTAHATVSTAVEAMKEGAFDYLTKPIQISELIETVQRALEYQRSTLEQVSGTQRIETKKYFGNIVAKSEQMVKVCEMIKRFAPTETTIAVSGESGTGKELIAEAIHRVSARSEGPFLSINCAALPETLIEPELFGRAKDSLTGADANKEGLFEAAEGGTLFLNEINTIPLGFQPKLLRALQNKKIRKMGGSKEVDVNVRIIAATSQNLKLLVKEGSFREDLYSRLSAIAIDIPPLKQRPADILPLVQHFIAQEVGEDEYPAMDNTVLSILRHYSWPGNVRELRNVIQACLSFMEDCKITKEMLPGKIKATYEANPSLQAEETSSFQKGKSLKAFLRTKGKEYLKTVADSIKKEKPEDSEEQSSE